MATQLEPPTISDQASFKSPRPTFANAGSYSSYVYMKQFVDFYPNDMIEEDRLRNILLKMFPGGGTQAIANAQITVRKIRVMPEHEAEEKVGELFNDLRPYAAR